jgi:ABC-type glutathione transport system ATPase component
MMMGNATHTAAPLLQVKHLQTHFFTDAGVVKSVEDVSFALNTGETLASSANPVPASRSPACRSWD